MTIGLDHPRTLFRFGSQCVVSVPLRANTRANGSVCVAKGDAGRFLLLGASRACASPLGVRSALRTAVIFRGRGRECRRLRAGGWIENVIRVEVRGPRSLTRVGVSETDTHESYF